MFVQIVGRSGVLLEKDISYRSGGGMPPRKTVKKGTRFWVVAMVLVAVTVQRTPI